MKTRKLKWKKECYYKESTWSVYDKKTNIEFFISYLEIDIVNEKFEVELISFLGDSLEPFYLEDKKTTKWDIKRFEKFELEAFKSYLINKTLEKLQSVVTELKNIKIEA